jgi:hypothetical protein
MFPPDIRPMATSIAVSSNWIFAFLVIVCFPKRRQELGNWVVFVIFAAVSFGATILGALFVNDPDIAVLAGIKSSLLDELRPGPRRRGTDIEPQSLPLLRFSAQRQLCLILKCDTEYYMSWQFPTSFSRGADIPSAR